LTVRRLKHDGRRPVLIVAIPIPVSRVSDGDIVNGETVVNAHKGGADRSAPNRRDYKVRRLDSKAVADKRGGPNIVIWVQNKPHSGHRLPTVCDGQIGCGAKVPVSTTARRHQASKIIFIHHFVQTFTVLYLVKRTRHGGRKYRA